MDYLSQPFAMGLFILIPGAAIVFGGMAVAQLTRAAFNGAQPDGAPAVVDVVGIFDSVWPGQAIVAGFELCAVDLWPPFDLHGPRPAGSGGRACVAGGGYISQIAQSTGG
jgi:hypothetical protein